MQANSEPMQIGTAQRLLPHERDFALAVANHRNHIFRFLLASLRDVDTAETLTQECFLKAYRSWSSFRGEASVSTWLTRIAINLQRDYWRNRRLQFWHETSRNAVDIDEARDWLPANQSSPEGHLLAREQVGQVWHAVSRLSEKQRTVFLLRFVEDLTYEEMTLTTGMREGTVKAHLSRALQKVRLELRKKART